MLFFSFCLSLYTSVSTSLCPSIIRSLSFFSTAFMFIRILSVSSSSFFLSYCRSSSLSVFCFAVCPSVVLSFFFYIFLYFNRFLFSLLFIWLYFYLYVFLTVFFLPCFFYFYSFCLFISFIQHFLTILWLNLVLAFDYYLSQSCMWKWFSLAVNNSRYHHSSTLLSFVPFFNNTVSGGRVIPAFALVSILSRYIQRILRNCRIQPQLPQFSSSVDMFIFIFTFIHVSAGRLKSTICYVVFFWFTATRSSLCEWIRWAVWIDVQDAFRKDLGLCMCNWFV